MLWLTLLACTEESTQQRVEPTFVVVTTDAVLGSEESPIPFSDEPISQTFTVTTLDLNADPYPFTGDLLVKVRPGTLEMEPWISVVDGTWTGDITYSVPFGPSRVWFTDEGDKDASLGREPSWSTGVSEVFHYAFPTVSEMNNHDDPETNHLDGEFAELRIEDRNVVVTVVGTDGFWITDLDSLEDKALPTGGYASLFIYTFSKPESVVVGSQLLSLNGNNQEYLGTTQFSFPTYSVAEDTTLAVPPAISVGDETLCDEFAMEPLESSLVEVSGATIPADFTSGSEDYEDYIAYNQWPATIGDCTFYVDSSGSQAVFDPGANPGATLSTIRGLVNQVWGKKIIIVTEPDDLQGDSIKDTKDSDETARSYAPSRPKPRHRDGSPANDTPHSH